MPAVNARVLPGFRLSLGYTVFYLSFMVLLPIGAVYAKAFTLSWADFWKAVSSSQAMAAYRLTFGASMIAAGINVVLGLLVAWVLVRYDFVFRRFFDALVDLPLALPTAVAGLAYANLYAEHGLLGQFLAQLGIQGANSRLGIVLVLVFTGFPFVVRTVQPVLESLDPEVEEAAGTLGAGRWESFRRVILPQLGPALLTGLALAFARALGEYGAVVFVAGNIPFKTEIAPRLIVAELNAHDYSSASAVAVVLLTISFIMLALINLLERRSQHHANG
jgi:sulfate transport system permease protein